MHKRRGAIVVAGAGGFIGGHLVKILVDQGFDDVRAFDKKPLEEWHQVHRAALSIQADLSHPDGAQAAMMGARCVFNLAADMGGMGFIENNRALCMLSVLTNTNLLIAAREALVERYFFASSACVYAEDKQTRSGGPPLAESDAYPAMPEDGYGWEKLFSERMCRHFREDFGLDTRVARYHNVYGPYGTWTGGREKAPAAICRKVAEAQLLGRDEIDIWGDGSQTRSFMYIDDCLRGTLMIADGDFPDPINLGSSELVSINQLVDMVEDIAGITLRRNYLLDAPRGVKGRNSDNTLIQRTFGWQPSVSLRTGLEATYGWVRNQVKEEAAGRLVSPEWTPHAMPRN